MEYNLKYVLKISVFCFIDQYNFITIYETFALTNN